MIYCFSEYKYDSVIINKQNGRMLRRKKKQVGKYLTFSDGDIAYTRTSHATIKTDLKDLTKLKVHRDAGFRIHHTIKDKEDVNFIQLVEKENESLFKNKEFVSFSEDSLKLKNKNDQPFYKVVFADAAILKAWQESLGESTNCKIAVY